MIAFVRGRKLIKEAPLGKIEALARSAYELLASTYYLAVHPTSRVFDFIISRYLEEHRPSIKPRKFYLEVGCGKTKLVKIYKNETANLVLVDISHKMILHSNGYLYQPHVQGLIASAFRLPIARNSIAGVYSFLGDAFNTPNYFKEVFRVMEHGGVFLHIVPGYLWATTLRKKLGIATDVTILTNKNEKIVAPSFVLSGDCLEVMLLEIGFSEVLAEDLVLPRDFPRTQLPEHILIPSQELNFDPYELPILTAVHANK